MQMVYQDRWVLCQVNWLWLRLQRTWVICGRHLRPLINSFYMKPYFDSYCTKIIVLCCNPQYTGQNSLPLLPWLAIFETAWHSNDHCCGTNRILVGKSYLGRDKYQCKWRVRRRIRDTKELGYYENILHLYNLFISFFILIALNVMGPLALMKKGKRFLILRSGGKTISKDFVTKIITQSGVRKKKKPPVQTETLLLSYP